MTKILVPITIAFVVGFLSHRFLTGPQVVSIPTVDAKCEDLSRAKSNLVALSQSEYLEYTKIKDLKEKYEKADELLGKVMLLFLADVGFKTIKSAAPELATSASPSPATTPPSVSTEKLVPEPAPSKPPINRAGRGGRIHYLNDERSIQEVLANTIIEDPKVSLAQGSALTRRQIRLLAGRYTGAVKFLDRKRGDLSVVWELSPDYSKRDFSGTFFLSIHGPGVNSDSRGRGNIDNIATLADDKEGFLVSACGDRCYLQLYYNSPSDQFYGNYYETAEGTKKSVRSGTVELRK
ncbi:hypothetical protein AZI86_14525 [Bdellovibrio bacteriovorus]|uniref:Uncharacterized protein n=1 Tax=Bdellovibrio bacteriovorus TaxID=959 RepID=A0A150WJT4_BDEBC|nr:hypothetical protein [Bdellovibrio bacteriovorus]KYG64019.1 hypothetical protein AZI86_14525 [Bdellovibrio bacteriovorus]